MFIYFPCLLFLNYKFKKIKCFSEKIFFFLQMSKIPLSLCNLTDWSSAKLFKSFRRLGHFFYLKSFKMTFSNCPSKIKNTSCKSLTIGLLAMRFSNANSLSRSDASLISNTILFAPFLRVS